MAQPLPPDDSRSQPVQPRPAATCILLRESSGGFELFLTRRLPQMKFVGGHHVFPGGKVDASDSSPAALGRVSGRTPEQAASYLSSTLPVEAALGYWLAAVRELFEETGVLLAVHGPSGSGVAAGADPEALEAFRRGVLDHEIHFYEELERRGWRIDLSRIAYFDHWVTPEYVPMRFDTRFFAARLPDGAKATHWPGEADEGFWIAPREAIERWERRELTMIPPTFMSIRRLMDVKRLAELNL